MLLAAEQREGSDPQGAAGETCATQIVPYFSLLSDILLCNLCAPLIDTNKIICQIIFLSFSLSLMPVTAVCKESKETEEKVLMMYSNY